MDISNDVILEVKDLSVYIAGKNIVRNITFNVGKADILAVTGSSGSGKSTLLNAVNSYIEYKGVVYFKGEKCPKRSELLLPGIPGIKLVKQKAELNLYATVYDNIAAEFSNNNLDLKHTRTRELLNLLSLSAISASKINDISGGEQQRVNIAKALASNPEILLLDEPFNQLDEINKRKLFTALKRIHQTLNTTIIFVTHNFSEVFALAGKVLVVSNGSVIQSGTVSQIYYSPESVQVANLSGECNVFNHQEAKTIFFLDISLEQLLIVRPSQVRLSNSGTFYIIQQEDYGTHYRLTVVANGVKVIVFSTELPADNQVSFQLQQYSIINK